MFLSREIFEFLIIHKPFLGWGHVRSHTKFGPDRFSRFDVYWTQTDGHPNRQVKYIYIKICLICLENAEFAGTYLYAWIWGWNRKYREIQGKHSKSFYHSYSIFLITSFLLIFGLPFLRLLALFPRYFKFIWSPFNTF